MKKKICQVIVCLFMMSFVYGQENEALMRQVVIKALPLVEGWCSEEKATKIMDLILETQPEVCVEIGVFGGASILPTAKALKWNKKGVVYAIDPWETLECIKNYDNDELNRDWWAKVDLKYVYDSYLKLIDFHHVKRYVKTMKMTSEEAAPLIDTIDILHIDGNHSEESSMFDTLTYFPKVKDGGYIWFDDHHWETTGKAFQYLSERCDVIEVVDNGNCYLFKKRF